MSDGPKAVIGGPGTPTDVDTEKFSDELKAKTNSKAAN